MLGDIRQAKNVYIVCGYTDMRKGLNSLVPFVQQNFGIDPYSCCGNQTALCCCISGWTMAVTNGHGMPGK